MSLTDLFETIAYILFNTIHFELAWIYRNIAVSTPYEHNGLERDEAEVQKDKIKHDKLMVANIILPVLNGVINFSYSFTWNQCYYNNINCRIMIISYYTYLVIFGLVYFLQVVSGVIIFQSLKEIRFYFEKTDALEFFNVKQMLLHGAAFGLYLVAAVIYYLSFVVMELTYFTPWTWATWIVCYLLNLLFNFLSQCLLAVIFWHLGTKEANEESGNLDTSQEESSLNSRIF
jgi:hypothetical protein